MKKRFYVAIAWSRGWVGQLPCEVAENIAFRNAETLLSRVRN